MAQFDAVTRNSIMASKASAMSRGRSGARNFRIHFRKTPATDIQPWSTAWDRKRTATESLAGRWTRLYPKTTMGGRDPPQAHRRSSDGPVTPQPSNTFR